MGQFGEGGAVMDLAGSVNPPKKKTIISPATELNLGLESA